ncbi:hypothetical protein Dthio_PD1659 [Desulfonatronospira thiodismutans ASO3-1]|uniref:Uncharacterized protein n=2 Tax=Desulfonatronovibrionaceae TaxID=3031459 RepID=D6SNI2_9BACT|nr:hypothetical protein Dthio_PD1659 [Desulfonatronospira thiodismutans ASO3-1]
MNCTNPLGEKPMQNSISPFFGLGFDLGRTIRMARTISFHRPHVFEEPLFNPQHVLPSGFELLVLLNRETGGS